MTEPPPIPIQGLASEEIRDWVRQAQEEAAAAYFAGHRFALGPLLPAVVRQDGPDVVHVITTLEETP